MARQSHRRSGVPGTGAEVGIARKARKAAWLRRQMLTAPTVPTTNVLTEDNRVAGIAAQIGRGDAAKIEAIIAAC